MQRALKEWIVTSNDFELNCFRCFSCLGISHGGRIQKGSSKDNRQSSRKNSDAGERQNFIEWKKLCSHDYLFVLAQSWSSEKTKRRCAPKRARAGLAATLWHHRLCCVLRSETFGGKIGKVAISVPTQQGWSGMRRWQTLRNGRNKHFVWKKRSLNFTFTATDLFVEDQTTVKWRSRKNTQVKVPSHLSHTNALLSSSFCRLFA